MYTGYFNTGRYIPYLTEELISSQPTKPGNPRYLFRTTHLCKKKLIRVEK